MKTLTTILLFFIPLVVYSQVTVKPLKAKLKPATMINKDTVARDSVKILLLELNQLKSDLVDSLQAMRESGIGGGLTKQQVITAVRDSFFTTAGLDTVGIAASPLGEVYPSFVEYVVSTTQRLATVITGQVSSITTTSASVSGNVTNIGTSDVSEKGFVLGTSANPTTANTKIVVGSGLGTFSSSLTSLTENTGYNTRAYAINGQGTAYGANVAFTTLNTGGGCANTVDYSALTNSTDYNYDNITACYNLTDGSGDYAADQSKHFYITNAVVANGLTIEFSAFTLAAGDTLRIQYYSEWSVPTSTFAYTWTSSNAPTLNSPITLQRFAFIEFITDSSTQAAGFEAIITPL